MTNNALAHKTRKLESFSGYHTRKVKVYEPENLHELKSFIRYCDENTFNFSLMGTGISFDAHFLHEHRVVSTLKFKNLELDFENDRITVGAGVTWGEITRAILPAGYVPYVAPTTSKATVGGSISLDTYSVCTPFIGRENTSVIAFKMLTTLGQVFTCSREQNTDLFYGAIGGLGVLGIIFEINYKIRHVGLNVGRYCMLRGFEGLDGVKFAAPNLPLPGRESEEWHSLGCVVYRHKGKVRTLAVRHRWVDNPKRNWNKWAAVGNPILIVGSIVCPR